MQLDCFQQANVVWPFFMPHQIVDEGRRWRAPEIQVLWGNDHVKAVIKVQELIAPLEFFCGVKKSAAIDTQRSLSLLPRKHKPPPLPST